MGENSPEDYVPEHRAEEPKSRVVLSDTVYDRLKWVALIVLPATSVLYVTLGEVWGLPNTKEVVGTITAIGTFLGVLLGLSSSKYQNDPSRFAGKIVYTKERDEHGDPNVLLVPREDSRNWENKKEVTFKIDRR